MASRRSWKIRIFIGLAIVAFAFFKKCANTQENPYTGKEQTISMSTEKEIAIGLQSAPQMINQYGGMHPDQNQQRYIDAIGAKLVTSSLAKDTPYQYEFHLLADNETINAFALPGGQIFITQALFSKKEQ